jgi:hypothetical protein
LERGGEEGGEGDDFLGRECGRDAFPRTLKGKGTSKRERERGGWGVYKEVNAREKEINRELGKGAEGNELCRAGEER